MKDINTDTIAAIATPPGNGGVAIIRVSGEDAQRILRKVFSHQGEYPQAHMKYGKVIEKDRTLDQGLAVMFYAPKSYTGEDVAELHLHGSSVGISAVLELVLASGARLAMPGEFSKRAFMNGKMDLTQAEAVGDYISSISSAGARASALQMEGALKDKLTGYQDMLTDMMAEVEAAVEYPEEDLEDETSKQALPLLQQLKKDMDELIETYSQGRVIKEGFVVAIAGKPNVGKSSLLNAMLGRERAIVSSVPGTTRDTVDATFEHKGIAIKLVDTAGIRRTSDIIEKEGVERSNIAVEQADLAIFMIDSSEDWDQQDDFVCKRLKERGVDVLPVYSKIDLLESKQKTMINEHFKQLEPIYVSSKESTGMKELKDCIYYYAMKDDKIQEHVVLTNIRHRQLLEEASDAIFDAIQALQKQMDMDCVSIDLMEAWQAIGSLTGRTVSEEIIDRVFEKFCLGK